MLLLLSIGIGKGRWVGSERSGLRRACGNLVAVDCCESACCQALFDFSAHPRVVGLGRWIDGSHTRPGPVCCLAKFLRRRDIWPSPKGLRASETSTRQVAFASPTDPLVHTTNHSLGWKKASGGFVHKSGSGRGQRGLSRARMETKTREARVSGWQAYAASVRHGGLRLRSK